MKIEVLGTACKKCIELENIVKQAIAQSGKFVEFEKVDDIATIMKYSILSTPGLVIDGEVYSSGRVPSLEEVLALIKG